MRWIFCNSRNPDESERRTSLLNAIDAWWEAFQRKADELNSLFSRKTEWDLPGWMEQTLQRIDPRLCWEYGPAIHGNGHRLVITPEADRELRPLVNTLLDRAPQLAGWEFYPYRLPEDVEIVRMTVEARTGGDISDVVVEASIGKHHRVDLLFRSPQTFSDEDRQASDDAFVAAETLLGEEVLDKWIGPIEVGPLSGGERGAQGRAMPLERLNPMVGALIDSLRDQLPSQPFYRWAETTQWTLYKLEPQQADDYPEQRDLFVAKSCQHDLWVAAHADPLFFSERFSRCGETFCYVKLDGAQGLVEERFADKSEIEDAIDDVLKLHGLGCHIGGGTGLRYSYIDLALTDLRKGVEAVRRRLQEGRVPQRSWILFFDADLAAEWVGVYDETPPPMDRQIDN